MRLSGSVAIVIGAVSLAWAGDAEPTRTVQQAGAIPLYFEQNQGQAPGGVHFLARGSAHSLLFSSTGVTFATRGGETTVRMELEGARRGVTPRGVDRRPGHSSYFRGNNPERWLPGVPHYGKVLYENIRPGVDLLYYGNRRRLEYDLIVEPGVNPDELFLRFTGADEVDLDADGNLLVRADELEIKHDRPVAYQEINGEQRMVASAYVLGKDGRVGFQVDDYDRSLPLTIDPVVEFSTMVGGRGFDENVSVVVDAMGYIYVAAESPSPDFPTTDGVFDESYNGPAADGPEDIVVFKMDPTGSKLIYSTFIGGQGRDTAKCRGKEIVLDEAGNAFVSGTTESADFPTTPGAFDTSFGGVGDAFALKLSPDGTQLLYSTFLGGADEEEDTCIALSPAGDLVLVGQSDSTDLPTTPGAFDRTSNGEGDIFVSVLRPAGSGAADLRYSTYLGGRQNDFDPGHVVDGNGVISIIGETVSLGFPTTAGAFDTSYNGNVDLFVVQLTPNGRGAADLLYSTYFGGSRDDDRDGASLGIASGPGGDLFLTGETVSTENSPVPFPITSGVFDDTHNGGSGEEADNDDVFVARLRPAGKGAADLIYSTYVGGNGDDEDNGIAVDSRGFAYVAAESRSTDFPMVEPTQSQPRGSDEIVVFVLDPTGSELSFSTYLGGSELENDPDIFLWESPANGAARNALADSVVIYVAGDTKSSDFPTTEGAFGRTLHGPADMFLTKIVQSTAPALGAVVTVSGASFVAPVAPDSIASAFVDVPIPQDGVASEIPLPTELGGTSLQIVDSKSSEWLGGLIFLANNTLGGSQINFHIPAGVAPGTAAVNLLANGKKIATGQVEIRAVAPGVFFAGPKKVAAAFIVTVAPDNSVVQMDAALPSLQPRPIDLGPEGTRVLLVLFGTGIRNASKVTATVGGLPVGIVAAGAQCCFIGLDQINTDALPRSLAGRGEVELILTVDGVQSNAVVLRIQ